MPSRVKIIPPFHLTKPSKTTTSWLCFGNIAGKLMLQRSLFQKKGHNWNRSYTECPGFMVSHSFGGVTLNMSFLFDLPSYLPRVDYLRNHGLLAIQDFKKWPHLHQTSGCPLKCGCQQNWISQRKGQLMRWLHYTTWIQESHMQGFKNGWKDTEI